MIVGEAGNTHTHRSVQLSSFCTGMVHSRCSLKQLQGRRTQLEHLVGQKFKLLWHIFKYKHTCTEPQLHQLVFCHCTKISPKKIQLKLCPCVVKLWVLPCILENLPQTASWSPAPSTRHLWTRLQGITASERREPSQKNQPASSGRNRAAAARCRCVFTVYFSTCFRVNSRL